VGLNEYGNFEKKNCEKNAKLSMGKNAKFLRKLTQIELGF